LWKKITIVEARDFYFKLTNSYIRVRDLELL
jgi:hypothetical protein